MTKAFRYRFEFARNHTLGNLMLSALEEATGSFVEAIDICERLLDVRGHVYPSTLDKVALMAVTRDGQALKGQANASHAGSALERVWLEPAYGCRPYAAAVEAISAADLIVLGPGSLYTSIIPNLLVPGIVEAIAGSAGKTLFICSLADMQGETRGLSAREHVEALYSHGMRGLIDYVLIHAPSLPVPEGAGAEEAPVPGPAAAQSGPPARTTAIRPVVVTDSDIQAIAQDGPRVMVRDVVDPLRPTWHDPHALRAAICEVMQECRLPLI